MPTATPKREVAKPGESRTSMTVFPISSAHVRALLTFAGSTPSWCTSSTSCWTGTGLKKCMPSTRSPGSPAAISEIDNDDVLDARIA